MCNITPGLIANQWSRRDECAGDNNRLGLPCMNGWCTVPNTNHSRCTNKSSKDVIIPQQKKKKKKHYESSRAFYHWAGQRQWRKYYSQWLLTRLWHVYRLVIKSLCRNIFGSLQQEKGITPSSLDVHMWVKKKSATFRARVKKKSLLS